MFRIAQLWCGPRPSYLRWKNRQPRSRQICSVLSVEYESSTTTSSAHETDSRHPGRFSSSLSVWIKMETDIGGYQYRAGGVGRRGPRCWILPAGTVYPPGVGGPGATR